MLLNYLSNLPSLFRVNLANSKSRLVMGRRTRLDLRRGSEVSSSGPVHIGFPLPNRPTRPSRNITKIVVEPGGKLVFEGITHLSNGCYVYVGKGAELVFRGDNFIGSDTTILCNKRVVIGRNSCISWDCDLIDDDTHQFHLPDGTPKQKKIHELIIGDNVAIQMGVAIPRGVNVSSGSIIAAKTVVRQDIEQHTLVYQNPELTVKEGITYGFEFF